jgi:hypothetical protein
VAFVFEKQFAPHVSKALVSSAEELTNKLVDFHSNFFRELE